jgi:hypothetical protein
MDGHLNSGLHRQCTMAERPGEVELQVDHTGDVLCVTLPGTEGMRMAEALDRCRRDNQACPLRDIEIEQRDEAVCLTLRPEDPAAFAAIGVERCLRAAAKKAASG